MTRTRTTKIKLLKAEKLLYFLIIPLFVISSPLLIVFSKATLSQSNIELSQTQIKLNKQQAINESLNMKINELASLDKILELASDYGLSYNNSNITLIESE